MNPLEDFEHITHADLDAISQLIAERTIATGVDRVITQEILRERCQHYTEVAKLELEKCGPEESGDSSGFCPTATVFGADGTEAPNVPVGYRDGGKRRMMLALSRTCQTLLAQAVILRHVATTGNLQQIAKAVGLNMPDVRVRQKLNYFEDRMWKWIEKNYGRQRLAALPPEFRLDCIVVGGMGPHLQDEMVLTEYRWENGKLVFGQVREGGEAQMQIIPRWWQ